MKKQFCTCLLTLILPGNCFSQTTKNSLSFAIGAAVPTGNFAKKELFNSAAGFASTGFQAGLLYEHKLSRSTSLALNLAGQFNPINTNAFEEQLSQAKFYQGVYFGPNPGAPPPALTYSTYPNWRVEHKSWFNTRLMVGLNTSFPVNKNERLVGNAGAMAGAIRVVSPVLKASSITDTVTALLDQSKASAFGFCYQLSGGLKYKLTEKLFLTGEIAWLTTNNIAFNNINSRFFVSAVVNGLQQTSEARTLSSTKQKITTLNLAAGIGIML